MPFSKDDWLTPEGKLSVNTSVLLWLLHLYGRLSTRNFPAGRSTARQFCSRWEGGMFRGIQETGNAGGKTLILDDAAIAGLEPLRKLAAGCGWGNDTVGYWRG